MTKYSFFPPNFVPGRAFRAQVPSAAMPTAWTSALRPGSVLTKFCALLDSALSAWVRLPPSARPITSPLLRSSSKLKPAAIPVILGCGVTIFLRAMFLLLGEARGFDRRLGDARLEPFLPALARRQAFLLIPPAFLIAHFGSLPRATHIPYLYQYIIMRVYYA